MSPNELQSIKLFSHLDEEEFKIIESLLNKQAYHANKTIYAASEPSDSLYIIKNGSVIITHHLKGDVVTLARLESGYFFGEHGLLGKNQAHSSEARSEVDGTIILTLSKKSFEKLKISNPEIALKIIEHMASVLSERLTEDTTRIAIISAISDLVNDPENLSDIKKLSYNILSITLQAIPSHYAFLGVYKKSEPDLIDILASIGTTPKHLPSTLPIDTDPYLHKLQTQNGEIVISSTTYKDEKKVFYAKRNILGRSITVEGRNIGLMVLSDKESGEFSNQNRLLLQIITGQISFALEEARLLKEQAEQEELKREYVEI
jgi:CRP-like cAMP-binding protein